MYAIQKFPRTPHLEGSRLQPGDQDLTQVKFAEIAGRHIVVEEKIDGANCGISFDFDGNLRLQSRGHYLTGGPREKQFALLKQWASEHQHALHDRLGSRYLMYGEWMFAKHTIFYNRLPSYFLEFDIFDTDTKTFLSTTRRRELLDALPVNTVPILHDGPAAKIEALLAHIGPSRFIDPNAKDDLEKLAVAAGQSAQAVSAETDLSGKMEGLYIKVEENSIVTDRFKYVRADFLAVVDQSGSHWQDRPLIRNQLK